MSDSGDLSCNLECVTGEKLRRTGKHEFVGPVKIVLVDPIPADYARKAWGTGAIHLVNLYIGFNVLTVLLFTLCFRLPMLVNIHITAGAIGFQLYMPSAILMLNPLFGGAAHLKESDRKLQHVFLQIASLVAGGASGGLMYTEVCVNGYSAHSLSGLAAMGFGGAAMLMGPCAHYFGSAKSGHPFSFKNIHRTLGAMSFLTSSICMCSGLFKPCFLKWTIVMGTNDLSCLMSVLSFLTTLVILLSITWRRKVDI